MSRKSKIYPYIQQGVYLSYAHQAVLTSVAITTTTTIELIALFVFLLFLISVVGDLEIAPDFKSRPPLYTSISIRLP